MSYSKAVKKLIKQVATRKGKMQLNGSFKHSMFATDIDLYQRSRNVSAVWRKVTRIVEGETTLEQVQLIRVMNQSGKKFTWTPSDSLSKFMHSVGHPAYIRVEGFFVHLVYPMECSIIYDFANHNYHQILKDILDKIAENKFGMFKLAKRAISIGNLLKQRGVELDMERFHKVVEDQTLGSVNLHLAHLKMLKTIGHQLPEERKMQMMASIKEDLRRLLPSNVKQKIKPMQRWLNNMAVHVLKNGRKFEATGLSPKQLANLFHAKFGKHLPVKHYDDIITESKNCDDLFDGVPYMVLYYPNVQIENANFGHFVALCLNKKGDTPQISYFDPLGYTIDQYKQFSPQRNQLYNEELNTLSWWLLQYRKQGVLIEDNHTQVQSRNPKMKTCGHHCALRCKLHKLDNTAYRKALSIMFGEHNLYDQPVYDFFSSNNNNE